MSGPFEHAIATLRAAAPREGDWVPYFTRLAAVGNPAGLRPAEATAIDGSHAVLADTGSVWVVAVRAVALRWPGPPTVAVPPLIVATLAQDAQDHADARYAAAGMTAPRVRTAEAFAEALRAVEEMEETRHALAATADDGLVLVDGALWGLPANAGELAAALVDAATLRHVNLVGISKRSHLAHAGVPLVSAATRAAHVAGIAAPWSCNVPDRPRTFVARLHAAAAQAYRVDVCAPANGSSVWSRLVELSCDAAYPGYPFPLALAHNAVAFTAERTSALRQNLEQAARMAGPEVARLLDDPHALLDRNV